MLDRITPLILTHDEEANLERTLRALRWAAEVIVVDSMSADRTIEIARQFPNVRVIQREIDTLAGQTKYGLQHVRTPWALVLDADYVATPDLVDELRTLEPPQDVYGYRAAFRYAIGGRPLRTSLYPPRIVLMRHDHVRIWQDGHTPRFLVDGQVGELRGRVVHDDRKSFARFLERQRRYMRQEADKLRAARFRSSTPSARIRKLVFVAPFAVLVHTLLVKGVILDGRAGLQYALERFLAEAILSRELLRRRRPAINNSARASGRP